MDIDLINSIILFYYNSLNLVLSDYRIELIFVDLRNLIVDNSSLYSL